jgi:hypothetical protein
MARRKARRVKMSDNIVFWKIATNLKWGSLFRQRIILERIPCSTVIRKLTFLPNHIKDNVVHEDGCFVTQVEYGLVVVVYVRHIKTTAIRVNVLVP